MDWTILGIQPTKDKKEITTAYRAMLKYANPEDDPEKFKALRAAYEEALALAAKKEEEPEEDLSPVGRFMTKVRALYGDYRRRIDPEAWRELTDSEECLAWDKREAAESALLDYFKENYYLPQAVWQLLGGVFGWEERREQLYETQPADFLDYVIFAGMRNKASLPYELFEPGEDAAVCDDYRRIYYRANQSDAEEMDRLLEQLDGLAESHPYGEALHLKQLLNAGDEEGCFTGYCALWERYPEDDMLSMNLAALYMRREMTDKAEDLYRKVLERDPAHKLARQNLAECLAAKGAYEEAKERLYKLIDDAGGDQKVIYEYAQILKKWNEDLISKREARLAEAPDDAENIAELAWCYLQNDREADAVKLAEMLPEEKPDPYQYHNLLAKAFCGAGRYAESLPHFTVLEQLLREMKEDGTEKTARRIRNLPEVLQIMGSAYAGSGDEESAKGKYEEALALAPENPSVITTMARLLMNSREYGRAAELLEKLTELMPDSYHGFLLLSHAYYKQHRDRDAYAAVERALERERGDLYVYVQKMRILLRNGAWDEVKEILDFLKENCVDNELSGVWCEAQYIAFAEKDQPKALELYRSIEKRMTEGETLDWPAELYYRMTSILGETEYAHDTTEDRDYLIALLDKGIAADPTHYGCRDYKAWLLRKNGRYEDALAVYRAMEAEKDHPNAVERGIADTYYSRLPGSAAEALAYYEKLPQAEEDAELQFYIGTCKRYLRDYEGAKAAFCRLLELDPEDSDGHKGLSFVYEYAGDHEAALAELDLLIRDEKDTKQLPGHYYRKMHLLRRLGRYEEAMAVVPKLSGRYGSSEKLKFDICCQFGLFDEAEEILSVWKKKDGSSEEYFYALVHLDLLRMDLKSARKKLAFSAIKGQRISEDLQTEVAGAEGNGKPLIRTVEKKAEASPESSYQLLHAAEIHCWYGSRDKAVSYAEKSLPAIERELVDDYRNETVYHTRKAIALAILGRPEEAENELALARTLELCGFCDYASCKDADIYEAYIAELSGEFARAKELYEKGHEKWPDELDFINGLFRLERKGV